MKRMRNVLLMAGLIALLPGGGVWAQRPPEAIPPRRAAQEKRRAEKAKEAPTPLERWNRLTPEQRQRVLAQMRPERRREFQQKLQQYRSLPPDERQQLRDRYQAFSQLPPEQQNHARELFRQFNSLPEDRRPIVRRNMSNCALFLNPSGARASRSRHSATASIPPSNRCYRT